MQGSEGAMSEFLKKKDMDFWKHSFRVIDDAEPDRQNAVTRGTKIKYFISALFPQLLILLALYFDTTKYKLLVVLSVLLATYIYSTSVQGIFKIAFILGNYSGMKYALTNPRKGETWIEVKSGSEIIFTGKTFTAKEPGSGPLNYDCFAKRLKPYQRKGIHGWLLRSLRNDPITQEAYCRLINCDSSTLRAWMREAQRIGEYSEIEKEVLQELKD
jgi:hypothetical protein